MIANKIRRATIRQIFLLDAFGALVTATLLSQVLARMEPVFGMPRDLLFLLAGVATCFAIYSLMCWLFVGNKWRHFLRAIAIANTVYCLITLALVVLLYEQLTWLGIAYFIGEIVLVMLLVSVEFGRSAKPEIGTRDDP